MRLIINTISWAIFILCFGTNTDNTKEIEVTKIAYKSIARKLN